MSFEEIIRMMENAEDYMDLYDAASYIVDDDLRVDVEQLIEQCEDDGEDVETAYSIVTSDLLDMKMYELNESVDIDENEVQADKLSDYISYFEEASNDKDLLNIIDEMEKNKNIDDELVTAIRQLFRNNRFMSLNNKVDAILRFIEENTTEESKTESLTESAEVYNNIDKENKDIEEAQEDVEEQENDEVDTAEVKPDLATLNKLKDRAGQQMSVGELNSLLQGMLEQHNELFLLKSDLMNMDLDRTQELVIEDDGGNFILSYDIIDAGKGIIQIKDVKLEEEGE